MRGWNRRRSYQCQYNTNRCLQIRKSLVIKFVIRMLVRGRKHKNTGTVTSDERKGSRSRSEAEVSKPIVKVVNVYHMAWFGSQVNNYTIN